MMKEQNATYIASCSMGKDSLAMVLKLLEGGEPLDKVIYFDTGADFTAISENAVKLERVLKKYGVPLIKLRPETPFFELMTQKEVHKRNGTLQHGYGFCGGRCRWGTSLKTNAIKKYYQTLNTEKIIEYVGIASDEPQRIGKASNATGKNVEKAYPLVTWGMTEKDCLNFCRARGWNWIDHGIDLYDVFDRVSCWCCANKNLKELKAMFVHFPMYWKALKSLQAVAPFPYKNGVTVYELQERFEKELARDGDGTKPNHL